MIIVEQTGKYKLLNFRQKWEYIYDEVEVEKSGLFRQKKIVTTKQYTKTGFTAYAEPFPLKEGDIIVESKYSGGYYRIAVLRKINEDEG